MKKSDGLASGKQQTSDDKDHDRDIEKCPIIEIDCETELNAEGGGSKASRPTFLYALTNLTPAENPTSYQYDTVTNPIDSQEAASLAEAQETLASMMTQEGLAEIPREILRGVNWRKFWRPARKVSRTCARAQVSDLVVV